MKKPGLILAALLAVSLAASPSFALEGANDGSGNVSITDKSWTFARGKLIDDVRSDGAECDGSTNDVSFIQDCVDDATALTEGGECVIPATGELCALDDAAIVMKDNVTIRCEPGAGFVATTGTTATKMISTSTAQDNLAVLGCRFHLNSENLQAINIAADGVKVEDNWVGGVSATTADKVLIEVTYDNIATDENPMSVVGNVVHGTNTAARDDQGIKVTAALAANIDQVVARNTVFKTGGAGIIFGNTGNPKIINNFAWVIEDSAFEIGTISNFKMSGNIALTTGSDCASTAAFHFSSASNFEFTDNKHSIVVAGCGPSFQLDDTAGGVNIAENYLGNGIIIEDAGGGSSTHNIVDANVVKACDASKGCDAAIDIDNSGDVTISANAILGGDVNTGLRMYWTTAGSDDAAVAITGNNISCGAAAATASCIELESDTTDVDVVDTMTIANNSVHVGSAATTVTFLVQVGSDIPIENDLSAGGNACTDTIDAFSSGTLVNGSIYGRETSTGVCYSALVPDVVFRSWGSTEVSGAADTYIPWNGVAASADTDESAVTQTVQEPFTVSSFCCAYDDNGIWDGGDTRVLTLLNDGVTSNFTVTLSDAPVSTACDTTGTGAFAAEDDIVIFNDETAGANAGTGGSVTCVTKYTYD